MYTYVCMYVHVCLHSYASCTYMCVLCVNICAHVYIHMCVHKMKIRMIIDNNYLTQICALHKNFVLNVRINKYHNEFKQQDS